MPEWFDSGIEILDFSKRNELVLKTEEYYGEFEEYIQNGEKNAADYADRLNLGVQKFIWMVDNYKKVTNVKPPEPLTAKMKEFNESIGTVKRRLTPKEKEDIYEALQRGGTIQGVSERFSVSVNTVRRTRETIEAAKLRAAPPSVPTPPPEPELIVEKLLEMDNVGVSMEGEYIVIRIPKKEIARKLFEGVI